MLKIVLIFTATLKVFTTGTKLNFFLNCATSIGNSEMGEKRKEKMCEITVVGCGKILSLFIIFLNGIWMRCLELVLLRCK